MDARVDMTRIIISKPKLFGLIIIILSVTVAWETVRGIPSGVNTTITPGSSTDVASIILYFDGTSIFGKSGKTSDNLFSTSDIGTAINNAIANLPTVTNIITGRTVPEGQVLIRDKPGSYSGTNPIVVYDDYYVSLVGETASTTSVENAATTNAVAIDIESTSGVLRLLHNPNNNLGGGTIEIRNIALTTSTVITQTNGIGAIFALGEGSTTNAARVILEHVGCYDLSGQNTCYSLRSNSGDDLYYCNDVFVFGKTYNFLVYVQANHFDARSWSFSVNDVVSPGTNAVALTVIPEGNFLMSDVHIFGTANAWLWVRYSGANPHLYAQFINFFTELTASSQGAGIQGSYRASFENPTTFSSFNWGAGYNPLNDTNINISSGYLAVSGSIQYDQLGKLAFPFATSVLSQHYVGPLVDKAAIPLASIAYTVVGTPIYITSSGGTSVSITIKDFVGNTMYAPGATISVPFYIPTGYTINFGACSPCPTPSVFPMESGSN